MKLWKIAALAGYVAGIAVALRYAKKSPAEIKAELNAGKDRLAVLWENLVAIHRDLFGDAKKAAWNETTQGYVREAKEYVISSSEDFRKEALARFEELKAQSRDWAERGEAELKKLYDRRMEYLETAKDLSRDAAVRLRTELQDAHRWLKSQIAR